MTSLFSHRSRLLAMLPLLLIVAGCSGPGIEFATTLDDGQKVHAEMQGGHPILAETDEVHINLADFVIDPPTKGVIGKFAFTAKHGFKPVAVMVEDVTNSPFILWIDDKNPALNEKGEWKSQTAVHRIDESKLVWLTTVSNSMRVFRFTFTTADGRKVIVHQAAAYPGFYKAGMRKAAGFDEPK